jgi:hypothetical protein
MGDKFLPFVFIFTLPSSWLSKNCLNLLPTFRHFKWPLPRSIDIHLYFKYLLLRAVAEQSSVLFEVHERSIG